MYEIIDKLYINGDTKSIELTVLTIRFCYMTQAVYDFDPRCWSDSNEQNAIKSQIKKKKQDEQNTNKKEWDYIFYNVVYDKWFVF